MRIVSDALIDSGLAPSRLELEITERIAAAGAARGPETLAELRRWGIRVALDDFGTGYSALSQLSAYPLDTVKIDRSFIAQLSSGASAEAIVRAIIGMASALGLTVVAEGVETARAAGVPARQRVRRGPGFLLARPVRSEQVGEALERALASER